MYCNFFHRMNLADIAENTRTGRENALLGDYETAMVYYQGVTQQIQRLIGTIKDQDKRHMWQQVHFFLLLLFGSFLFSLRVREFTSSIGLQCVNKFIS